MPDTSSPGPLMIAFAVAGVALGALGTLTWLVFLLASSPNSSPQQAQAIRWMMLAAAIIGLATFVGGIWLTAAGRPGLGGAIGAVPMAALFVAMIVLTLR
jgi:hypothetical protein